MTTDYKDFVFKNSDWTWGKEGKLPEELELKDGESRDVGIRRHTNTIDFMNLCMKLHHDIWSNVHDDEKASALYIDNVRDSGSGFTGVNDMNEVLIYLKSAITFDGFADTDVFTENPFVTLSGYPVWEDWTFQTYKPTKHSLWPSSKGAVIAPEAFVNFMTALSSQTSDFLDDVEALSSEAKSLLQSSEEKKWETVKEKSKALKSRAQIAAHVLKYFTDAIDDDLRPALKMPLPKELRIERQQQIIESYKQLGAVNTGQTLVSGALTVVKIVDKIDAIGKAAVLATDFQTKGELSEVEANALAGLSFALGFVPILGPGYASIVSSFCGYLPHYRKIIAGKKMVSEDVVAYLKSIGHT